MGTTRFEKYEALRDSEKARPSPRPPDFWPLPHWEKLAADGSLGLVHAVKDKQVLLERGQAADTAFFLREGAVEVFQTSASGQGLLVKVLRGPALFGVLETVSHEEEWLESARTLGEAALHRVPKARFLDLLRTEPEAALECLQDTCDAFCSVARREPAAMADTEARLAMVLLAYVQAASRAWDGGHQMVAKRTQSDLARTIGASERSVNAVLAQWKSNACVTKVDGRYIVHDVERLEEAAGEMSYCLL